MLINDDGSVAGNISGNFLLALFINEAAEPTHINVMARSHVGFYDVKKSFNGGGNISFIDSGFLCNLIDNVCFGHGAKIYIVNKIEISFRKIRGCKFKRSLFKRKMNLLIITQMCSQNTTNCVNPVWFEVFFRTFAQRPLKNE